jgi:hypothetical protein
LFEQYPHTDRRAAPDPICDAPCDRVVDGSAGQLFFVGGRGVSRSKAFVLADQPPAVTLEVKPGRSAVLWGGWALTGVAAVGMLGGAGTMIFADDDRQRLGTGGLILGVGVAALVVGGILVAIGRTRIRLRPGAPR